MDNCIPYFITICIVFVIANHYRIEYFETEHPKESSIGETLHSIDLRFAFPNIIPLRKQLKTWTVNVPLTPFRAPLVTLPKDEKLLSFIVYRLDKLTPVRNQGDCGCCWAFSVCNMLSDRMMIISGGLFRDNLSVQQLLSCYDRQGCDGGSPEETMFWLEKNHKKLVTESQFPYKNSKGGDVKPCPAYLAPKRQVGVRVGSVVSIVEYIPENGYDTTILAKNIENMKRELQYYGPFYCAMTVYSDFFSYSGLIPYRPDPKSQEIGGHAIEIVGFCDKGVDTRPHYKDVGYWICRNSWGKDWPLQVALNGFFTIVMGENCCGIESRCGAGIPELFDATPVGTPMNLDELRYISIQDYTKSK